MTSSRVVRGTKSKIFFCACAVVIVIGVFACYNNTLSQLEDVRKSNNQCHQQQENLSTQLQVIFDYKQRLEKSLKTEKADHQQTKKDLDDERTQHEKTLNEANTKFSSLQQHYNLLQTQHEDFKGENSKIQQQHVDKISSLQEKLIILQNQLKQAVSDKEREFENLKTSNLELTVQIKEMEQQLRSKSNSDHTCESHKNHVQKMYNELKREFESLSATCLIKHNTISGIDAQGNNSSNLNNELTGSKPDAQNVGDNPSNNNIMAPLLEANKDENFNNDENVIAAPNNGQLAAQMASAKTSSTKTNDKSVSKAGLIAAPPLKLPSVTPSNGKKPSPESELGQNLLVLPLPYAQKRVPAGVVPPPEIVEELKNDVKKPEKEEKVLPDEINNAFPNRYRSNLIQREIANEDKALEAEQKNEIVVGSNDKQILKLDMGEKENNAALEVVDPPLNEHKAIEMDGGFGGLDEHDKISNNQIEQQLNKKHIDSLGGFHDDKLKNPKKVFDGQHGDYDKILQNDLQLEENDPEEDDDPDYGDNVGRPKDPAVRN